MIKSKVIALALASICLANSSYAFTALDREGVKETKYEFVDLSLQGFLAAGYEIVATRGNDLILRASAGNRHVICEFSTTGRPQKAESRCYRLN